MTQISDNAVERRESAILDEIESIGVRAEVEGRELERDEVARIEKLSKQFDDCEKALGHVVPGKPAR